MLKPLPNSLISTFWLVAHNHNNRSLELIVFVRPRALTLCLKFGLQQECLLSPFESLQDPATATASPSGESPGPPTSMEPCSTVILFSRRHPRRLREGCAGSLFSMK